MAGLTGLACLPIFATGLIARWQGALFLGSSAAYVLYLIHVAMRHAVRPAYSAAMVGFVPDPSAGILTWNVELVVWIDEECELGSSALSRVWRPSPIS